MVMGRGFDSPMVVVLVLGSQCDVFNGLDFFFSTVVYGCKWILLMADGGNGAWMWWLWYVLGSKYLRIKYLESLLFCIGKPRLKHV